MSHCQIADAAPYTHDLDIANRLWEISEKLTSGQTSHLGEVGGYNRSFVCLTGL